jgi:hypothetical protein
MWYYNDEIFDESQIENNYGFIYLIENLYNDRKYIGRKFFTKSKIKQLKGKKKKIRVDSDWESYYGSSEELTKDVEALGKDNFRRSILRLCKTLGETKYQETKYQFICNVLEKRLDNGDFEYYNSNIAMKFTRRNIGLII